MSFLLLFVSRSYHEYVGSGTGDMRSMIQGVFTVPAYFAEKAVDLIIAHYSEGDAARIVTPTPEPKDRTWDVFDENK